MRQKHIQEGHSGDLPQLKFDASDLMEDSVEPLLHYLVTENQVQEVESVLCALPNSETYKTSKLRLLASFAASPAMLQLLGECASQSELNLCVIESIKGRNEMTMSYNLASLQNPLEAHSKLTESLPLCQIMSHGWLEGLKLWCEASRQQLKAADSRIGKFKCSVVVKRRLSDSRILEEAAKHPAGEEAVLYLWRESGLLSYISDIPDWASRSLRHVAKLSFSVTLATELLEAGASIDFQTLDSERTALHCAAGNDSAEGAEMIRFLLLKGADPEATHKVYGSMQVIHTAAGIEVKKILRETKRVKDEKGAQNIHNWLGKSWDELVEETKHIRYELRVGQSLETGRLEQTMQT